MDHMQLILQDLQAIEEAELDSNGKLLATTSIACLRFLRDVASRRGKSLDELLPEEVVQFIREEYATTA